MKKAKSKVVGKPAHHAKPAAPKKAKKHAAGAASKKHQPDAHQKHLAHLAAEHTAHEAHLKHIGKAPAKKRGLALGDAVACCAAEALAASLRLLGLSVGDEDVLTLHRLSGADDDAGGTILAALEAASESGLAGVRPCYELIPFPADGRGAPLGGHVMLLAHDADDLLGLERDAASELDVGFAPGRRDVDREQQLGHGRADCHCEPDQFFGGHAPLTFLDVAKGLLAPVPEAELLHARGDRPLAELPPSASGADVTANDFLVNHSLILGVDLPGPHTVLATPDGWWSWGELHDPAGWPDAVIEEAWWVAWR